MTRFTHTHFLGRECKSFSCTSFTLHSCVRRVLRGRCHSRKIYLIANDRRAESTAVMCQHVRLLAPSPKPNKMATSAVKSFQIKATIIQSLSLVKSSLYYKHTSSTILIGMNIALFLLYSMPSYFERMQCSQAPTPTIRHQNNLDLFPLQKHQH